MTARTTEPSSVGGRGNVRDPSADGLQMVSAREQQAGLAVALSRNEAHVRRRWVQRSRSAEARVAMWILGRTPMDRILVKAATSFYATTSSH
jgi:hypothetical protein